jgi:hypothetical protein
MALIWADNFQSYGDGSTGAAKMRDGLYAETTDCYIQDDPDANAPAVSKALLVSYGSTTRCRFAYPAGATTTAGIAMRLYLPSLSPANSQGPDIRFNDAGNEIQLAISFSSTGQIFVWRGDRTTLIGSTAAPVITAAAWNHIEIKTVASNSSSGTVEVRVNGVAVISLSGVNTVATANVNYAQTVFAGRGNELVNSYFKDCVWWDGTGSTNNNFLGTVSVVTKRPDTDVTFNWTPSTGTTGFPLIDEATPNDADFISAGDPPPSPSTFGLENLEADVTSIRGVITVARMRKTDGGTCNAQVSVVSGASVDAGLNRPMTTAFTYWWDVAEVDPATSSAWTPVGFNAASLRINRTS